MNQRKLVIVSGVDRSGKSTLVKRLQEYLGEENCSVYHHGAPAYYTESIFDFYRDHITEWVASGKEWCLFDRSWACSYCLDDFRRHNHGSLNEMTDIELELLQCDFKVIHVGIEKPWSWSAPHHLVELKELFPDAPPWKIRDEYVARQKEHRVYQERLGEFYEHFTAFPHVLFQDKSKEPNPKELLEDIEVVLGLKPGPVRDRERDALAAEFIHESIIKNLYS